MQKEHFEILLEEMRSKFDLVLEGHAALDRKIDNRFEHLNAKIEHNTFMIDTLNQKIDNVEERLGKRIDDVDAKLSKRIDDVESRLSNHIDEVETNLTRRIDAVDANLSAHRADTESHGAVYRVRESGE